MLSDRVNFRLDCVNVWRGVGAERCQGSYALEESFSMFGKVAQDIELEADCIEGTWMVFNAFTTGDGIEPNDYVIAVIRF